MRVCSRWARGGHEQAPQVRRAREARSAPLWRVGWRAAWEKGLPPIVNQEAGTPQAYQRSPAYALQKVRCQNGSSPFCTPPAGEASWYMGAPQPLRYALTSTLTSTAPPTGMKSCSPHGMYLFLSIVRHTRLKDSDYRLREPDAPVVLRRAPVTAALADVPHFRFQYAHERASNIPGGALSRTSRNSSLPTMPLRAFKSSAVP